MEGKKKFIFFDFDGVIADSFSAAYAVNKMIFPSDTEDSYRKRFEGNINEAVSHKDEPRANIDFFYRICTASSKMSCF
jgi:beta-phosphoglucomutase-like phosphatase (HAD superfamily)